MMTLKDTTEAAFALFNRWIYSKTLENQAEPPADDGHVLCQLALLAVTLQVVELQNAAVCELCYIINKFKTIRISEDPAVYGKSKPGNSLRYFMSDLLAMTLRDEVLETSLRGGDDMLPREILVDIIFKLRDDTGISLDRVKLEDYMIISGEVKAEEGKK